MSPRPDQPTPAQRGRRSLTPKGSRTREALLLCARQVFQGDGYNGASVSEIGRRCGVSQGTFYQYFRNKDQVFRELIDAALADFWARAGSLELEGAPPRRALRAVLALLLDHCRQNADLHRVLNEFDLIESVTTGYYDSIARFLRDFFRRAASRGECRALDPNVIAYSLLGLATFQQRDWDGGTRRDPTETAELAAELIEGGISGPQEWTPPRDLATPSAAENKDNQLSWDDADAGGRRTRRAIFQAAEHVFGQYGYSRAGIAEITRRAGVAQGTFYVHFKSKEELLNGVVRFLSHELRRELRRATDQVDDRRVKEIEGMLAFYHFLRQHSQIYRIVSESEAIVPESAAYYYRRLASGYRASLALGQAAGQIRSLPLDFLVPSLMGINHMVGLRWLVWKSSNHPELPRQVLADAVDLVLEGLSPR